PCATGTDLALNLRTRLANQKVFEAILVEVSGVERLPELIASPRLWGEVHVPRKGLLGGGKAARQQKHRKCGSPHYPIASRCAEVHGPHVPPKSIFPVGLKNAEVRTPT